MKRLVVILAAISAVALAVAQGNAPFTIVRPADGAKVRETIHVLFPKGSLGDQDYVGFFLNGNFLEATLLKTSGKFLQYDIDTKGLSLPDGPLTIEAVLYANFQEKPRIIDRSSVQVTLTNRANIAVPKHGYNLRYHWQPGYEWRYDWQTNIELSTISQEQARLGGHAAAVAIDYHDAQYIYAMDNAYDNGDALLRMQLAPPRGKYSLTVATVDDPTPKTYGESQMYPLYMRVNSHGWEQYGTLPKIFPSQLSISGSYQPTDLFGDEPLPTLPTHAVKPGDVWESRFQLPSLSLATDETATSFTQKIPARAEFVAMEWEMGSPCAKIHQTFQIGSRGGGIGANKIKTNADTIDEVFWFAVDKGVILRLERTVTEDRQLGGESTAPMGSTMKGDSSSNNNNGGRKRRDVNFDHAVDLVFAQHRASAAGTSGNNPAGGGGGEAPVGRNENFTSSVGGNNNQQGAPAAPKPQPQLYRVTFTEILTLER